MDTRKFSAHPARKHFQLRMTLLVTMVSMVILVGCELLNQRTVGSRDTGSDEELDAMDDGSSSDSQTSDSSGQLAQLGESCEQVRCDGALLCINYRGPSYCSERCDTSQPFCPDASRCIRLRDLDYGACAAFGAGAVDSPCETTIDCGKSMVCVDDTFQPARCVYACDFTETIAPCPAGYACSISTAGVDFGLCIPL